MVGAQNVVEMKAKSGEAHILCVAALGCQHSPDCSRGCFLCIGLLGKGSGHTHKAGPCKGKSQRKNPP